METFAKLFGSLLVFVYHCFDRIVILGHIPLLTRPENIVYFFRDVHQAGAITKEVLRPRTAEYNRWVDAFARNHKIPIEWAEFISKLSEGFVLFHKRVCGPLANSLFNSPPQTEPKPATRLEAAYRKADQSIQQILQLLAA